MQVINPKGIYRIRVNVSFFFVPVHSLRNAEFRASTCQEVGEWIIAQNYTVFEGWSYAGTNEERHEDRASKWNGVISLKSPKGSTYGLPVEINLFEPLKKTFDEMTPKEQNEAIASALAKLGI